MRLNAQINFNLLGSIKIGLWSNGRSVMWSDVSRFTLFQNDGRIRVGREAAVMVPPSYLVPTVQACGDSAMIWGWSGLGSAMLCAQKVSWLHEYTEWTDYSSVDFFLPCWHGEFQHDSARITHGLATMESRPKPHWESFRGAGEDLCTVVQISNHQYKILGEKCMQL